ncbi:hypothetical protein NDR87_31630 [Nocardia sp. CDC159]|uniref:Uncharacterized protein n=1 Tax=Nocardia pulmonis TaxID=2951408 RepID=A0A9X2EGR8_9NOCA|nr:MULTISPECIES: hypothetical protein [Nocardia]MCM6777898.1 hypothetical protein [Nocardia pulmonis]MCM6790931.1 hypothetical protein [Nocardia sp. CDC159]
MTVQKFRRPEAVVEAMQMTGDEDAILELLAWIPADKQYLTDYAGTPAAYVKSPDGSRHRIWPGYWVVCDNLGGWWMYTPARFRELYAPLEGDE